MRHLLVVLACSVAVSACDSDKKKQDLLEKVGATPSASAAPTASAAPKSDRLDVVVDAQGVYAGGERVNLSLPDAAKRLATLLAAHPIGGKRTEVTALRNARAADVATTVAALGDAGAPEVVVKTQDRSRKETPLTFTPGKKAGKVPECTVVVALQKDRSTASWHLGGGTATRYSRGMAGPDLSTTLDAVTKQVAACSSSALVVSAEESVDWGLTFDLALAAATAQPPLKATTWVLAPEPAVPGRPVKLD